MRLLVCMTAAYIWGIAALYFRTTTKSKWVTTFFTGTLIAVGLLMGYK